MYLSQPRIANIRVCAGENGHDLSDPNLADLYACYATAPWLLDLHNYHERNKVHFGPGFEKGTIETRRKRRPRGEK